MEINFPKLEEKILKFWQENKIFEKSVEQRKKAKNFVFYEGPPTANARPGIHHILARIFKDIIPRYKTMRGLRVLRKAGWDTHGLPVELEIEKKLDLKTKKDIEKYGIAKFNKKCRGSVWEYKKDWEKLTERIGFWLDMEDPYITYTADYIETVWRILKEIYKKGLLYQDYKVVPYCPRCGTSLSSHEVALGYKKIKEPAIYVKFKLKTQNSKLKTTSQNLNLENTYFLVWTTTPWTLPGNVALAVGKGIDYVLVSECGEAEFVPNVPVYREESAPKLIIAKDILEKSAGGKDEYEKRVAKGDDIIFKGVALKVIETFRDKDLLGLEYEQLFDFVRPDKHAFKVVAGDFVTTQEGSGIVHIAPAFGEDDMNVAKGNDLPVLMTVNLQGKFKSEIKKWAGIFVKDADPKIIEDLKERNILLKEELYEHDYPFCWRCNSPLLYYAKESWFINMQKVKNNLISNNQKINWVPSHLKEGRFGEWLRGVKDWTLSRERYWGTPLPVWQCKNCEKMEVIGSLQDLLSQKFSNNNYFFFRHGHSLRQVKNLASSWPEKAKFPLTKEGKAEVLKQAKKLKKEKISLIFSSDLLRTKETAEIISKETGAKIIFDKRLREVNVGIFNNKDAKLVWQYLSKEKNPYETKIPKGESFLAVRKRVYNFLKATDQKEQNKNILIVSHEFPLSMLEKTLAGFSLKEFVDWRRENRDKLLKTGTWRKIEFKKLPFNPDMELDFHRPYADEVKFYCQNCLNGTLSVPNITLSVMERVPEVIDCWFDSGSMPFSQAHWPFSKNSKFKIQNSKLKPPILFPADYISEGIDQTRGWFYTLLAVSTLLGFGPSYKNVISLGHVLDEKGEKMSKSKGNAVDPWQIIEKYGADATRWYFYTINQPGDSKLFSEKDVDLALKKFILTLWNCYAFFETYAKNLKFKILNLKSKNLLDKWIISRLNGLILEATQKLDNYDVTASARAIENFVINDLSLWYIRRSRRRFQNPANKKELKEASEILNFVILTLNKLSAPFIPFLSEKIHQNFYYETRTRSVHLEDWPKINEKLINKELEEKMILVREIVNLGLKERARLGIKVRQPIASLKIKNQKSKIKNDKKLLELIKDEVNVKKIIFDEGIEKEVELDTKITPELKEEGIIREVTRNIQEMRKKAGFRPEDKISVWCSGSQNLNDILAKNKEIIRREGKIKALQIGEKRKEIFDAEKQLEIDKQKLWLGIKKDPDFVPTSSGLNKHV
jgi:isoleucyl-tRNA synthetase